MGVPPANSVTKMRVYLIYFLIVLQQSMCGVQLLRLLEQMTGLGVLHNSLSGFPVLFLLAGMFRLLAWQRYAG
jgi:hypothetical protein